MTSYPYPPAGQPSAWQQYLRHEHAARDEYLQTVRDAHAEYLTGPWPDRDAYTVVERRAWITYHAAGRAAWQVYAGDMTSHGTPPATPGSTAAAPGTSRVPAARPGPGPAGEPYLYPVPSGTGWPQSARDLARPVTSRNEESEWLWPSN